MKTTIKLACVAHFVLYVHFSSLTINDVNSCHKKDEALIAEMDACLSNDDVFQLWWLGQSGYLLQWKKQRVLIDPYLSDSLTKNTLQTNKPHTRMSELVVKPELLENILVVTSSHNHTDHLDGETLMPVIKIIRL